MTALTITPVKLPPQSKAGTVRLSPATLTVGTPIMTSTGERPVEDLKPGDRIVTKDLGLQTLKFVAFRDTDLRQNPDRTPLRIPANAFGDERPTQDLFVAPDQRIALRHPMFDVLFTSREVLAMAQDLAGFGGIEAITGLRAITYVSLGFLQHHLIYSGNMAFDLGPKCQKTARPTLARDEARMAISMMQPSVTPQHAPAGFPLH